jgi:hypothetical protein
MSENISMTRIADLPEMGSSAIPFTQMSSSTSTRTIDESSLYNNNHLNKDSTSSSSFNETSNIYIPLNPHPNPYGISDQVQGGIIPPIPQQSVVSSPPQQQQQQQPEYRLPQRDIPMDITNFTQDEQIQPNYIPKPKLTSDYVERHEKATVSKIREYEEEKKKEVSVNQWIDKLYQPVILGIIYFIFQLPIINTIIFKRFSFLSIYNADGNFNLWGLILKSLLFAFLYMLFSTSTQYFIDFFQ